MNIATKNSTYTIQNQIVTVLADQVTTCIIDKVKAAKWFMVIADEVTDVSNREQLSIQAVMLNLQAEAKDIVAAVDELQQRYKMYVTTLTHIILGGFLLFFEMFSKETSVQQRCGRQIHCSSDLPASGHTPTEYYQCTISIPWLTTFSRNCDHNLVIIRE